MVALRSRIASWAAPDPAFALSRTIFLRALAVVFAVAFLSFAFQVRGLIGAEGILPVSPMLEAVREQLGWAAPWRLPTLFWLWSDDAALIGACALGVLLALALFVGLAPRPVLIGLWLLYLSLVNAGQIFMTFQWDVLLLEAAAVGFLLAPPGWRPRSPGVDPPSRLSLWLARWLLFRVMFLSGMVKLLSGDEAWRALTAMEFHYWTQPLPNPISPLAHGLPSALHTLSTLLTFAVEIGVPFLVFGPRRLRLLAAAVFVAFQGLINLTGSYGFFGLLNVVLCLPLIDDAAWSRLLPRGAGRLAQPSVRGGPRPDRLRVRTLGVAALVALLTGEAALARLAPAAELPGITPLRRALDPFHTFNAYGLFAVMTRDRREVLLEGSRDGRAWQAYAFRYKPDRLDERPRFAPLHMPRLDWQLWFAALRGCHAGSWVFALQHRLLTGSQAVLDLLASDPFEGSAPRFLRSLSARYEFAGPEERSSGVWWTREPPEPFCPPVTLAGGRLVRAPTLP